MKLYPPSLVPSSRRRVNRSSYFLFKANDFEIPLNKTQNEMSKNHIKLFKINMAQVAVSVR